jgi:hypothetical protein
VGRSATYRRWFVATTLGELVAFTLPTGVWASTAIAGLDERVAMAPVILAGAGEGAVLAYAQSRALRCELPDFDTRRRGSVRRRQRLGCRGPSA